jgi:biopolymer transport protein ExbD
MADVQVKEPKKKGPGKKGKKQKHRMPVRIDMTPMVDVVMLLITFFMLTTVFNTPQTMEINMPPSTSKVEVAESSLLTVRVMADGSIYWNMGIELPQLVTFSQLRALLVQQLQSNPKLVTLVKFERDGTYGQMVDVMDELNMANIQRFSLAPFQPFDKELIGRVKGA